MGKVIDKTQSVGDLFRVSTSEEVTSAPKVEPENADPLRTRSLMHHHDFRQLWAGDAVGQLGTQLVNLAIPIMAVRLLGADEFQMGLLGTFELLAFLVIGLLAGAWVDRWRKKRLIITADLVRGAVLLTLPAAWLLGVLSMTQVYVVALVVGIATVFFDVAHQSYLPELVPSRQIGEGNAKLQALQSTASIGGPALGATLIRLVGAPLTIGATALSMAASVLFVSRIQHVEEAPSRDGRRPLRTEIWEGLSFVLQQSLLRRIVLCTMLSNFFAAISSVLIVLFVIRDLGLTEATLGLVFSVGSIGGLTAALTVSRFSRVIGEGRTIPLSALLTVPFAALTPLATQLPPVPALAVGAFGVSFGAVSYNVIQVSFRQRLCPKPLLGRMNASIRFIVWGSMPIGAFVGGLLGGALGVVPTLWLVVAGFLVAGLTVLFSPLSRMRDLPRQLDAHAEA